MKYNIAIVGATGIVGKTTLRVLEERGLGQENLFLFASKASRGKKIKVGGKILQVRQLTEEALFSNSYDYALFCTDEHVSGRFVERLALKGTIVIDFSTLYRKTHPLIVPEINMERATENIICNPNCSTVAAVVALGEIHKRYGLKRIVYSTYQAVSGAGKAALEEMKGSDEKKLKKLPFVIKNNLIPFIGAMNGEYSSEEEKMIYETKKLFDDYNIKISASCVRVPIDVGHSISIFFETKENVTTEEIYSALYESEGVRVVAYPMPKDVRGQDDVLVGRVKKDEFSLNSFSLFVCSDNLRKGAAQNGVQILQGLIAGENDSL